LAARAQGSTRNAFINRALDRFALVFGTERALIDGDTGGGRRQKKRAEKMSTYQINITTVDQWIAFANKNEKALIAEFGSVEAAEALALDGNLTIGGDGAPTITISIFPTDD
jgi:hypothetical protein